MPSPPPLAERGASPARLGSPSPPQRARPTRPPAERRATPARSGPAGLPSFPVLAALALLAACSPAPVELVRGSRPNLLLIVVDDMGFGDLGCYGSPDASTPRMDRLAQEGVRCTSFYVSSPMCSPSRASLLSGRSPQRHGLTQALVDEESDQRLERNVDLLPEVLARFDYETALVGKWHLGTRYGDRPLQRGFEHFFGMLHGSSGYFHHSWHGTPDLWRDEDPVDADGRYSTELFADEAIAFVEQPHDRPWLLVLSTNAPHLADDRSSLPSPPGYAERFDGPDVPPPRRDFLGAVAALDEQLGRVLDALDAGGQSQQTLVVLVSDNGPREPFGSTGSLSGGKDGLAEGGIRVPAIWRWPGTLPAGSTCDEPLSAMDVMPTILVDASGQRPRGMVLEGRDALPTLAGLAPSPHAALYWTHAANSLDAKGRAAFEMAVRRGDWKLHFRSSLGASLYDVAHDPAETVDHSAERPGLVAELQALLDQRALEERGQ